MLSNCNRNFRGQPFGWNLLFFGLKVLTFTGKYLFWNRPWLWYYKYQLSHALARYEPSNDQNLIHRHIGRHCINYVPVLALFTIIFLVEALLLLSKLKIVLFCFAYPSLFEVQNPHALILNIEGATDCYRLKSQSKRKEAYLHRITVTFLVWKNIIFQNITTKLDK